MINLRQLLWISSSALLLSACGTGSSSDRVDTNMTLDEMSNGFGQLVPYTVNRLGDNGQPTPDIVSIRTREDMTDNLRFEGGVDNQLRPVPQWPETSILPSGAPGNHFVYVTFRQPLDISTVLSPAPGSQETGGLTGTVTVLQVDPQTGNSTAIRGRAFVNGQTYGGSPVGVPPTLELERWVELSDGRPVATRPEGVGFPGTQGTFNNAAALVSPRTLVFVVDTDNDLSTLETFPSGVQIRMRVTTAVRSTGGETLESTVLGNSTVGPDFLSPEIVRTPAPDSLPLITPGNGDFNVDPRTTLRMQFTEPVQPLSVGPLDGLSAPGSSSLVDISFGEASARTNMVYTVRPVSVFDMSTYEVIPAYSFPGSGPDGVACDTFSLIDVTINPSLTPDEPLLRDLANNQGRSNGNQLGALTNFTTGNGGALTNVPVLPDAIVVGRLGAVPGISVLDLNGYGQGTGTPRFTEGVYLEGESNFPNNPNLQLAGLVPPLQRGECTINGGSAGVFTLSKDSSLNDLLVRPPTVTSVGDMMLGHALDSVFNNADATCQAEGGNACSNTGEKLVSPSTVTQNTQAPTSFAQFSNITLPGVENLVAWAPHPNPPAIIFPPLCVTPFLGVQEPSSVRNQADNLFGQTGVGAIDNALVPGDPFGTPGTEAPRGLLTPEQNMFFVGPDFGVAPGQSCFNYAIRQQVGQFLYVVDRQGGEIVVLNSNRMTVVDRIQTPDPTSLAMGPNVDILAVSNQLANVVSFINIDPNSSDFHRVIQTTVVGTAPRGLAWDPGNEDLLVCNEGSNNLSIISAASLQVRRTVGSQLNRPFEVAITQRHAGWGTFRNVYYAYIINRTGTLAVFESGPNGVNGWGFDDVVGNVQGIQFRNPKAIQAGPNRLVASVWVAHEGPIDPVSNQPGPAGEGAISNVIIESFISGQLALGNNQTPGVRDMQFGVFVSIGEDRLSGIPVDIGFDNQRSFSALQNVTTSFSAGAPVALNGKSLVRGEPTGLGIINTHEARYLFAAIPNNIGGSGVVDVVDISAAGTPRVDTDIFTPGVQSVAAPNANFVVDYWRQ
ncbi:MAG: hypothetical protein ACI8QZ_003035 [Chlamydiales bacterium]|jgi:hypothetical protein